MIENLNTIGANCVNEDWKIEIDQIVKIFCSHVDSFKKFLQGNDLEKPHEKYKKVSIDHHNSEYFFSSAVLHHFQIIHKSSSLNFFNKMFVLKSGIS